MSRRTHDHELKVDSTTKRLTLLRNPEGQAYYATLYEDLDHQPHLRFIQDNWIGGSGQYNFSVPDMYFDGESIDTTQEGVVFLGPLIYTVHSGDAASIYGTGETAGWGNIAKVGGITATDLAKIDGVAVADIAKINGVAV